jgi:hypothetical protein
MNLILTTAYFPPIEYIALIENKSAVFIEGDENYQRQSYRNRMLIKRNGKSNIGEPLRQPITIAPFSSIFKTIFNLFTRKNINFYLISTRNS